MSKINLYQTFNSNLKNHFSPTHLQDIDESDGYSRDPVQRPRTISESIIQSCKEVVAMREGKILKRSLDELFLNIEKWVTEENNRSTKQKQHFLLYIIIKLSIDILT